jgi:hypothetical protein
MQLRIPVEYAPRESTQVKRVSPNGHGDITNPSVRAVQWTWYPASKSILIIRIVEAKKGQQARLAVFLTALPTKNYNAEELLNDIKTNEVTR